MGNQDLKHDLGIQYKSFCSSLGQTSKMMGLGKRRTIGKKHGGKNSSFLIHKASSLCVD
jgi:hypothetical protein